METNKKMENERKDLKLYVEIDSRADIKGCENQLNRLFDSGYTVAVYDGLRSSGRENAHSGLMWVTHELKPGETFENVTERINRAPYEVEIPRGTSLLDRLKDLVFGVPTETIRPYTVRDAELEVNEEAGYADVYSLDDARKRGAA